MLIVLACSQGTWADGIQSTLDGTKTIIICNKPNNGDEKYGIRWFVNVKIVEYENVQEWTEAPYILICSAIKRMVILIVQIMSW